MKKSIFVVIMVLLSWSCAGIEIAQGDKDIANESLSGGFIKDILDDERQFFGKTVVIIGERKIAASEFRWFVQKKLRKDLGKITYDEKKKYMDEMIDREMMLIAALDKNLDKDKEVISKAKEYLIDLAINWMFKAYVTDKVKVTDDEINEQIKSKRKKDETVEMARERILREIQNRKKKRLDDIWTAQCYREANVLYNDKNLEFFVKKWQETKKKAVKNNPRFPFLGKEHFNLTKDEKNKIIADFDGGEISVEGIVKELMEIMPSKRPVPLFDFAKKLAEYALIRPVLGKKAFDENWYKAKEVREVLADRVKSQLINKIHQVAVRDRVKDLEITEEEKTKEIMENWKKSLRGNVKIEINENFLHF